MKNLLFKPFEIILRPYQKKVSEIYESTIPKVQIQDDKLNNAKLLSSREVLLEKLPKNGIVAEIGVDMGDFSQKIIEINKPKKLHLIDLWGSKRYGQDKRELVEKKFQKEITDDKVNINIGYSTDVANEFNNNYFDWIYIDSSHRYNVTKEELEKYEPKIKEGGIIAGHDYIVGNWVGRVRYGVIEAVHEFCEKYNWEILYLTMELSTSPSFAIKKI